MNRRFKKTVTIVTTTLVFVVVFLTFPTNADDSRSRTTRIKEIDTEALLLKQLNNRPELSLPTERKQPFHCACRRVWDARIGRWSITRGKLACKTCRAKIRIDNIFVERKRNIRVDYPPAGSAETIPGETLDFDVVNCSGQKHTFEEKLTLWAAESLESEATSKLKKVEGWEVSFELKASLLKKAGLNLGAEAKWFGSVTVETSEAKTFSKTNQNTIEKPFKMDVPPFTAYRVIYSDAYKKLEIPAEIEVVLEGDITEDWTEISTGKKIHKHRTGRKLSGSVQNEKLRTVTVDALITIIGSSRDIKVKWLERKLTPDSEECRL